jgi:two-component system LytT family sensor kinase
VAQSALGLLFTVPLRYLYRWIWFWPVRRRVLLAVLLTLAFAVLWAVTRLLLFMAMTSETGLWSDFGGWLFPSIFVFVTWAALYHGIKYYQLLQRQREMLLEVEAEQRREAFDLMELKSLARDAELRPKDIQPHAWVFDESSFYVIINVAVGAPSVET